jgi:hypothetical protein
MNILTEKDLLHTWEAGQNRPLWFRAMLVLAHALPGMKKSQLADLTIGQRNYFLLKLRRLMVGSDLDSCVYCPQCGQSLEFKMNMDSICAISPRETDTPEFTISLEGIRVRFRPLTSRDLAACSQCRGPDDARTVLLRGCVIQADQNGEIIDTKDLPPTVINELGEKMAEIYDPQVEIRFRLQCPACSHSWSALFDILSFFWAEIDAQARRLLDVVHLLARAYGWSEAEIRDLSTARKNYYLKLIS